MLKKLLNRLLGCGHDDALARLVQIEYPREYAVMKRDGVVDFRPFIANVHVKH
jgi:hypothetical protein